jgi:hypothetical protein
MAASQKDIRRDPLRAGAFLGHLEQERAHPCHLIRNHPRAYSAPRSFQKTDIHHKQKRQLVTTFLYQGDGGILRTYTGLATSCCTHNPAHIALP